MRLPISLTLICWEHLHLCTYGKNTCSAWKNSVTALSSRIKGLVAVEVPKLERVGEDRSSSRKHGNPDKYGINCGPRIMTLSLKIICKDYHKSHQ